VINLQNKGTLNAGSTGSNGTVTLANLVGGKGTLNMGGDTVNAKTSGTLNAAAINAGQGSSYINFNQLGAASINANITQSGSATSLLVVTQASSGTTTLTGSNTYRGDTFIRDGELALSHATSKNNLNGSKHIIVGETASETGVFNVSGIDNGFTLAVGQALVGYSTVKGDVIIGAGSTLAPGKAGALKVAEDAAAAAATFRDAITTASNNVVAAQEALDGDPENALLIAALTAANNALNTAKIQNAAIVAYADERAFAAGDGTLTFDNGLTINGSAILEFELDSHVVVKDTLDLTSSNGTVLLINNITEGVFYTLFELNGGASLVGFDSGTVEDYWASLTAGWNVSADTDLWEWEFKTDGSGNLLGAEFTSLVAPVPEPGTWALMLGGLGVLAYLQRARRRS